MLKVKHVWLGLFLGLALFFGGATHSRAKVEKHPEVLKNIHTQRSGDAFQVISQPFEVRVAVILASVTLIGGELWWFLLKKPTRK